MIDFERLSEEIENVKNTYDHERLIALGRMCSNFKKRPSEYYKNLDDVQALALDMTCVEAAENHDQEQRRKYRLEEIKIIAEATRNAIIQDIKQRGRLYTEIQNIIRQEM